MNKLYWATRIAGYVAGGVGLLLFVQGRQQAEPRNALFVTGATLLLVSFVAFLASYILYLCQRLSRR